MSAYYNENDPKAAAWLRELIKENLIAPGIVDERSVTEIKSHELNGYKQCHFFAGIGGWSLSLRLAGWPDDEPVWTGSCPCRPFSVAGKGGGTGDGRHLWPTFFGLIRDCRPPIVFGEQVASAAVVGSSAKPTKRNPRKETESVWLDGVFTDLESASYSCGAGDIPAAGVGAPHIRQRLYWVADADSGRLKQCDEGIGSVSVIDQNSADGGLAHTEGSRPPLGGRGAVLAVASEGGESGGWSDFALLPCLDGKTRRIEPGTFPLVDGLPPGVVPSGGPSLSECAATGEARVSRLRGYGNAIVPQVAAEFILACCESIPQS